MTRKRLVSLKLFIFLALLAALIPIAGAGWKDLYYDFLERTPPKIEVLDALPRGIGITPVSISLKLSDSESGLDEVVVRTVQKGSVKELFRKSLGGRPDFPLTVEFPGDKTDLEEGSARLEVRVFDRSFWSNSADFSLPLAVDFRRPKIEVLTSQHNATIGGSQLIFYKAYDESLAISGVKVGNQTFLGFPARGIDTAFEDPNIFVAIYATDASQKADDLSIRAFAEDQVGNATSVSFTNRMAKRTFRDVTQKVSEDFLRDRINSLAEANFAKIREMAQKSGKDLTYETKRGGIDRLVEEFKYVNEDLRRLNEDQIVSLLTGPRFERYWDGPFMRQPSSVTGAYGDQIEFTYDTVSIGHSVRNGYEFLVPKDKDEVYAVNNGIVVFSDDIGVYGRCLGIDHGLGIVSIYGFLDNVIVKKGDSVQMGQKIGFAGQTGIANANKLYFEMRVQGTPVDAREWWDNQWFYAHITSKINEVKHSLGIPVYKPL